MGTKTWTVYIVETESGKLYTGIALDPEKRFEEHRSGKKGAKFFRMDPPKKIVYREEYPNRSAASQREYALKQLSRSDKLDLWQKKP